MTHSSTPGKTPSLSNRLIRYLDQFDNEPIELIEDEFDRIISRGGLRINRFIYVRELDLALVVLTNRRVITQSLSAYPVLFNAPDEALANYTISESGVYWPMLDADLSLRGLLMSEVMKSVMTT